MKILIGLVICIACVLLVGPYPFAVGGLHHGCMKCISARADIGSLNQAIAAYAEDRKDFPPVSSGIEELVENEYIKRKQVPIDPWGNEYNYSVFSTETHKCFMVWTFGSDNEPGGEEEYEQDIFLTSQSQCLTSL